MRRHTGRQIADLGRRNVLTVSNFTDEAELGAARHRTTPDVEMGTVGVGAVGAASPNQRCNSRNPE